MKKYMNRGLIIILFFFFVLRIGVNLKCCVMDGYGLDCNLQNMQISLINFKGTLQDLFFLFFYNFSFKFLRAF